MRNTMSELEIFDACFDQCFQKETKDDLESLKDKAKEELETTVVSTSVDKNGRTVNEHNPYKSKDGEIQVINTTRKEELNKDKYIAELEKHVSEDVQKRARRKCMKEATTSRTMNIKPSDEFKVEFRKAYETVRDKLHAKLLRARGLDVDSIDTDSVREKALKMVKGKQAN